MDENTPPPSGPSSWSASPPPPPPPVIVAPPAPPARRGRGWMVFSIILVVLLLFSMLLNLGSLLSRGLSPGRSRANRAVGPKLDEAITEDNGAVNKIAVVEIGGIITGRDMSGGGFSMVEVIKAQLKRAQEDEHVKAVILKVDSPGGEVLASDQINRLIIKFQSDSKKPVVASMGNLAASGGYYVSAPCRWIVAEDMTITGSIGVIMHGWNYRGLMNKVGILPEVYKSGKFKDMMSGERNPEEVTPEERAMVQSLIDETYKKFKDVVQKGRDGANKVNQSSGEKGRKLDDHWADYADGRVLSGTKAYELGFVDQLGDFQTAVDRAKTIASISRANLVEYPQRFDLSDLFRMFGESSQNRGRAVKVDLGLDMPKLMAGQLYFLYPNFMR
jgi:protease-4